MKYLAFLLVITGLTSCGIISKQYYYEPSAPHQKIRGRYSYTDSRMIYSKFTIRNKAGDSIGSMRTANGVGHPLLMGPLVPVIPVGGVFLKNTTQFTMDLTIDYNKVYYAQLAIDSNNYKRGRNHVSTSATGAAFISNTGPCYMIVNDTAKILLEGRESSFMRRDSSRNYMLTGNIRFNKVKTMKLVTGNALLDSTLKNITFTRKSRIKFDLIGPGY